MYTPPSDSKYHSHPAGPKAPPSLPVSLTAFAVADLGGRLVVTGGDPGTASVYFSSAAYFAVQPDGVPPLGAVWSM